MADWAADEAEILWKAYKVAQGSADHTDKQCFVEVVSRGLRAACAEGEASMRKRTLRFLAHDNLIESIRVCCDDVNEFDEFTFSMTVHHVRKTVHGLKTEQK